MTVPSVSEQATPDTATEDVQFIKQETVDDFSCCSEHKIDNYAPLWLATQEVKTELEMAKTSVPTTLFTKNIYYSAKEKQLIELAIEKYKKFTADERASYLYNTMKERDCNGSISGLTGKEAVAAREISRGEVLGHFAGEIVSEQYCEQYGKEIKASQSTIDTYSYAISDQLLISGYQRGNITTRINAPYTYCSGRKKNNLPKQNACFVEHKINEKLKIPFIIATKSIKQGEAIWIDYGKNYWVNMRANEAQERKEIQTILDSAIELASTSVEEIQGLPEHQLVQMTNLQPEFAVLSTPSEKPEALPKSFVCPDCDKKFFRKEHLQRHTKIHSHEKPFLCQFCGKTFRQSSHLKRHQKSKHFDGRTSFEPKIFKHIEVKKKELNCPECDRKFYYQKRLEQHRKSHTNNASLSCDKCSKSFSQSLELKKHQKLHLTKKFQCTQCGLVFRNLANLEIHQKYHVK